MIEDINYKSKDDYAPDSLDDQKCIVLLSRILENLIEIKKILEPGKDQLSDLHKLIIPRPKVKIIQKSLEVIRQEHVKRDIMRKKNKQQK